MLKATTGAVQIRLSLHARSRLGLIRVRRPITFFSGNMFVTCALSRKCAPFLDRRRADLGQTDWSRASRGLESERGRGSRVSVQVVSRTDRTLVECGSASGSSLHWHCLCVVVYA